MPIQSKAGTPYPRIFDPKGRRVEANGTQPFSAYSATFARYSSSPLNFTLGIQNPLENMDFQLLLFGSDYPTVVRGVQYYDIDTYSPEGVINAVRELDFSAVLGGGASTTPSIPQILPVTATDPLPYQKIARGTTLTNGVKTAGFPVTLHFSSHGLWETDSGDTGDRAGYAAVVEVLMQSGGFLGQTSFMNYSPDSIVALAPVILYEPDFTQEIVDSGYKIVIPIDPMFPNAVFVLDVVGLWNVDGYVPSQPPPMVSSRRAGPVDATPAASPLQQLFHRCPHLRRK